MTTAILQKKSKKVRRVKKQARVLTYEQLNLLFQYGAPYSDLYRLAYWSGSRCSEIRELTADARRDGQLVILQSKVSAEKRLPIDDAIAPVLDRLPTTSYLFPSSTHGDTQRPIGRTSIHNHLSELATDLELPGVTTHSFRRSRATHLYQAKMAPAAICKITGHRSVAQLMEYIDIATEEAAAEEAAITAIAFPNGFS